MSAFEIDSPATSPERAAGRVAVLGAGLIGRSWTALLLAAGASVAIYDPDPTAQERVREGIASAWPQLAALGLATTAAPRGELVVTADARVAVEGAGFVQESVPERLAIKHELYAAIEPALAPGAILASSASGLTLTELQGGWRDPGPLVLGHPFNPPHLIPLVEVMGNARTRPGVVDAACAFYAAIGKVPIVVRKEVPGHVANRLQAALWREAIHLVREGVASVDDVDTAISSGPGLRWAVMGPTRLFHLGGDEGGLASFCERYADSFDRWWDDLGAPHLDDETARALVDGLGVGTADIPGLVARRDVDLVQVIAATHRGNQPRTAAGAG